MRKHCSNDIIFEEEVATIKTAYSKEALEKLKIEITSRSLTQMWDEFSKFLNAAVHILWDDCETKTKSQISVFFTPPPAAP
jgi:hypothetical protein